ncbi:MAG: acetyl-CoA carboxylase biotin carboxyl carrier protein subunit [Bacillota bacterium]
MAVIESPLSGKVVEILIEVGQKVAEDDELIIVEAMKMENPVYATEDGVVKEIKVEVWKQVSEGDVLVVLE